MRYVLLLVLLCLGCDSGAGVEEMDSVLTFPAEIEYRVSGTAESGAIQYYDGGEAYVDSAGATLPFSHTFTARSRQLLYLLASARDDGELRLELLVNGVVVKRTTFSGPNYSEAIGAGDDDDTREVFYLISMAADSSSGSLEINTLEGVKTYDVSEIDKANHLVKFDVVGPFRGGIRATAVQCGAFSILYAPREPPYLYLANKVIPCLSEDPQPLNIDVEIPGAN